MNKSLCVWGHCLLPICTHLWFILLSMPLRSFVCEEKQMTFFSTLSLSILPLSTVCKTDRALIKSKRDFQNNNVTLRLTFRWSFSNLNRVKFRLASNPQNISPVIDRVLEAERLPDINLTNWKAFYLHKRFLSINAYISPVLAFPSVWTGAWRWWSSQFCCLDWGLCVISDSLCLLHELWFPDELIYVVIVGMNGNDFMQLLELNNLFFLHSVLSYNRILSILLDLLKCIYFFRFALAKKKKSKNESRNNSNTLFWWGKKSLY